MFGGSERKLTVVSFIVDNKKKTHTTKKYKAKEVDERAVSWNPQLKQPSDHR